MAIAELLMLIPLLQAVALAEGWEKDVSGLSLLVAEDFKTFVGPVVQIAANAYRYPKLKEIPGWRLAPGLEPLAPSAGAHAIVFQERSSGRIVLAFRGTDLTSTADKCADLVLFGGGVPGLDFPEWSQCEVYTSDQLDYFTHAVDYTNKVLAMFPGAPLLLTGHSLGAALAIMVSAFVSRTSLILPVVAFGSPGTRYVLKERSLSIAKAEERRLIVSIGDEWDIVSRKEWKQMVGIVCSYEHSEPVACVDCWKNLIPVPEEEFVGEIAACENCFFETHLMSHVLKLVASGAKPACQVHELVTPATQHYFHLH